MKYIIVSDQGNESAIIFDELLNHKQVARNLLVVSAGFVYLKGTKDECGWEHSETQCYGESISLGIASRPNDITVIEKSLEARL